MAVFDHTNQANRLTYKRILSVLARIIKIFYDVSGVTFIS